MGSLLLVGLTFIAPAAAAASGQLTVASCQSDPLSYSTQAFVRDVTAGMRVHSACTPQSYGLKGLSLANVVHRGKVQYRSFAALKMAAPAGTTFSRFTWQADGRRRDCGFAIQLWAEGPGVGKLPIRNYPARSNCRRTIPAPDGGSSAASIAGATLIIIRVQCVGRPRGSACSARRSTYYRLTRAEALIADPVPPTIAVNDVTHVGGGDWVDGRQFISYEASDNVGVRSVSATLGGTQAGEDAKRLCRFAVPDRAFATTTPCPNGPGLIEIDTTRLPEGSQPLVLTAVDSAGNVSSSSPVTVRIDNTPPGRVDIAVVGGDAWRNSNDFTVAWRNPAEPDSAPIDGADYRLCRVGGRECVRGGIGAKGLSSLRLKVPAPGEWQLFVWRRDDAGNEDEALASDPVTLRYDAVPPRAAFEPLSATDPTLVTVDAADDVSGLASGAIEISRSGSGVWMPLTTQMAAGRLTARFDDAALPAGTYLLRARVADQAHNGATTEVRRDGQPMAVTLPVRVVTGMQAAFQIQQTVTQTVRNRGRRVPVRRHVTVLKQSIRARPGEAAQVVGRLTNATGEGIGGQGVSVFASSPVSPEHSVGVVQTDASGGYRYTAVASSSQTLRFAFTGSAVTLPAQVLVHMTVPAVTSFRVNRKKLTNGQTVRFSGALQTNPAPPAGKLLELQVLLPKGWETFRTIRTDRAGRWTARYHFTRTYGVQHYRFRAKLPAEAGYPFSAGRSRAVSVVVRGRR